MVQLFFSIRNNARKFTFYIILLIFIYQVLTPQARLKKRIKKKKFEINCPTCQYK